MAVYTRVNQDQVGALLTHYPIGQLVSLREIAAGVENSNYFLDTEQGKYVFTIFEKRVNPKDLPFYLGLMEHYAASGVLCPQPIKTRDRQLFTDIKGKPCAIVSFLEGHGVRHIKNFHFRDLGEHIAKMHEAGNGFSLSKKNDFGPKKWQTMFDHLGDKCDQVTPGLTKEIETQLNDIERHWPKDLPSGIIHADLFPDNVFYEGQDFAGVIDFYFACEDYLAYELAICMNAWCFERFHEFNATKSKLLLQSYHHKRPLTEEEREAMPMLARGAAMRFLLTRLHDWVFPIEDALVTPKNPLEYLYKLRFHQGVSSCHAYGL